MIWESLFTPSVFESALRIATPLLLAALGGALTHHAGIFNIAREGMMLAGSFTAVAVSYFTSSWVAAILAAIVAGLLFGFIYGLFTVRLKADFIVTGIAINLLALGLTTYLLRALFNVKAGLQDPRIQAIPDLHLPLLGSLGPLNTILNDQSLFTYLAFILPIVLCAHLSNPIWTKLRAAGSTRKR
jgi:simple sugar transport system permease protein